MHAGDTRVPPHGHCAKAQVLRTRHDSPRCDYPVRDMLNKLWLACLLQCRRIAVGSSAGGPVLSDPTRLGSRRPAHFRAGRELVGFTKQQSAKFISSEALLGRFHAPHLRRRRRRPVLRTSLVEPCPDRNPISVLDPPPRRQPMRGRCRNRPWRVRRYEVVRSLARGGQAAVTAVDPDDDDVVGKKFDHLLTTLSVWRQIVQHRRRPTTLGAPWAKVLSRGPTKQQPYQSHHRLRRCRQEHYYYRYDYCRLSHWESVSVTRSVCRTDGRRDRYTTVGRRPRQAAG